MAYLDGAIELVKQERVPAFLSEGKMQPTTFYSSLIFLVLKTCVITMAEEWTKTKRRKMNNCLIQHLSIHIYTFLCAKVVTNFLPLHLNRALY